MIQEDEAPLHESEELTQQGQVAMEELESAEEPSIDYTQLTKTDFVELLEKQLELAKSEQARPSDFKRTDEILKDIRPYFDQIKKADKQAALDKYIADNSSEDGFEYKYDEQVQRFDSLYRQIKEVKNHYFQELEKSKDRNFVTKTKLLQRLRDLVEQDESNASNPGSSWQEFKNIQLEWRSAGNISSPHNSTLWATFHALEDRYYSNRNIYYELKELDRKKNLSLKAELVEKVEGLSASLNEQSITKAILEEAQTYLEEYKHIGPGPKAEQEQLWQRMKEALDAIHNARRAQTEEQRHVLAQNYEAKSKIYEALVPFTVFTSNSINEWNEKSKEVMALQDQWNAQKGAMLREEGRELSKKFWATIKVFFNNKSEFFRQLESKREQNLKQKTELCEQAEAILATGEDTATNTDKIIALQKQWKNIGQVPEKYKESIFKRFKEACDAYFDRKRAKNNEVEKEFLENLAKKQALTQQIEDSAKSGEGNLDTLNEFKAQWSSIGFVPKKDMQSINKRYIEVVNSYVSAIGKLSTKEREQVILENEVAVATDGESIRNLQKKEGDIRRKMTQIENDLAIWQNNIEFFGRSKGGEKVRAEFEKKISSAQKQLADLKHQLKILREAL